MNCAKRSDSLFSGTTMSSAYITRTKRGGAVRHRVRYRLGGRETSTLHGGSFETVREAKARRDWIAGELAGMRVPDLQLVEHAAPSRTLSTIAETWRMSRLDVSDGTAATHRVNLGRILPHLGSRPVESIAAVDVSALVVVLHEGGMARESIRKTKATLAMVLDYAGVQPNPARDSAVKLPRETKLEIAPPTSEHVLAVHHVLPARYRLALLVLDATGMRVGELEALTWGDVDEPRGRWRVSQAVAKTGRARWVPVPPVLFEAVTGLVAREDRTPERRVFEEVTADRLRTAITRACTTAGVPAFSPHDLRHRRISLEHLRGEPWARIGERVGQRNLAVTANTYTHVLSDEKEIDYGKEMAR